MSRRSCGAGRSRARRIALGLSLVISIQSLGCASVGPKAQTGAALGAASGGLIAAAAGGDAAGIIGGVLLGGLVGGAIGDYLDQRDRELAAQAAQQSFEYSRTGTTTPWQNPDSGHSGSFTPTRTYQNASGQYCREYQQTIVVDGQQERAYGTACRQPDGSWKIQS